MIDMTDERAAEVLAAHNEWRRYNGETGVPGAPEMGDPAELGRAIDHAVSRLRSQPPADTPVCTGDAIRCHDGHGCECAMRGQPPAEAQRCTCPSGDGSLRWPCPAHPAEAQPVAKLVNRKDADGGKTTTFIRPTSLGMDLPLGEYPLHLHPSAPVGVEALRDARTIYDIACIRAEARAERLAEALRWYVENDDTNEGQEGNEYWLAGRDRAIAVLRDHDQEGK